MDKDTCKYTSRIGAKTAFDTQAAEILKQNTDDFVCGAVLLGLGITDDKTNHTMLMCGDPARLVEILNNSLHKLVPDKPEIAIYTIMSMCQHLPNELVDQIKAVFQKAALQPTLH